MAEVAVGEVTPLCSFAELVPRVVMRVSRVLARPHAVHLGTANVWIAARLPKVGSQMKGTHPGMKSAAAPRIRIAARERNSGEENNGGDCHNWPRNHARLNSASLNKTQTLRYALSGRACANAMPAADKKA